ncbi:MAG: hypothetical protein B0D92_01465 [Spirochaeta sp. LUC14_002_19_P3]|nr:MAG: hypothetical protein B0D92_01465 [Spirochaeta sp. LUC14_002_19_P3]
MELFNGFYAKLYRIVWGICGQGEAAEEICQEAFLRYYERRDRLPGGDEACYWLIRVAKNLALNYEKRRRRENEVYRQYSLQASKTVRNDGEHEVLADESLKAVQKALSMVPYKLRIVLILKEYADYPYSAIAKILHITENNVKIRVFRARQHLIKLLSGEELYVP